VREVVVIAREDGTGEKRLVAYLVAEQAPADLADSCAPSSVRASRIHGAG